MRLTFAMLFVMGGGVANAAPQIALNPRTLSYGELFVDDMSSRAYDVTNVGDAPLIVTDMLIDGPEAFDFFFSDPFCGFGQDCAPDFTLAPGATRTFEVYCEPGGTPGDLTSTLTVTSNAANASGNDTIALDCMAVLSGQMSNLSFSPATVDFGVSYAEAYITTLDRTLTITNNGDPSTATVAFMIEGATAFNNGSISLPSGDQGFLAPGQSQTFTVRFSWFGAAIDTAPLVLRSVDPSQAPISIPLFAEAAYALLVFDNVTDSITMPTVVVGQTSTFKIRLHNGGDFDLQFESAYPSLFCEPSCSGTVDLQPAVNGVSLAPGQSIELTLSCTPLSEGVNGSIAFETQYTALELHTIAFGCPVYAAFLTTDPQQIQFGDVPIGTSQNVAVRVINSGSAATDLVAIAGGDAIISVAPRAALPITLGPGEATTVDVTFAPTASGLDTVTFTFDAATGGDASLTVSGNGFVAAADVTPTSYDFGTIPATSITAHPFQLHNGSEKTLTVTAVALDAPADFSTTLAAGTAIAAGATASFDVRATPSMLGQRHATLTIASDLVSPIAIPLDALAVDPDVVVTTLDLTPSDYDLDLGAVDVDVGARTGHVTLQNVGANAVTIETCSITGDPAFALATACPFTIAAGASADVGVAFDPSSEAAYRGMLTLSSAEIATGSMQIGVHGLGINQHVALSTMTLAFPDTFRNPTTPSTLSVTIHNTALQALDLSSITVTGDGFSLVGPATATLAPDASQDITVAFAPTAVGTFTGELVLGNADDPAIARVALTGNGIARDVGVMPLSVDFGVSIVGVTEKLSDLSPDAITISNLDPTTTFTITRVTITGDPSYSLIGPSKTVLAPGDHATLDVSLTPNTPGTLTATIDVFIDNDRQAQISLTTTAMRGRHGCAASDPTGVAPIGLILLGLLARRRRRWS